MIRSYKISGMTCSGCQQIVKDSIARLPEVKNVHVNLDTKQADIESENHISIKMLQSALAGTIYELSEIHPGGEKPAALSAEQVQERNGKLVADYVTAIGSGDYDRLLECLHPHFAFEGGIKLHSAKEFIKMRKEHLSGNNVTILKNEIKGIFVDGNDSYVIYDMVTNIPVNPVLFMESIHHEAGKIVSTKVKFDPFGMKKLIEELQKEKARSNSI